MPPVTPGAYLFRIRAAGDPSYAPPSRMQARLQRLELTGAQVRAVAADEASLARHRLAEGDLHGARGAHALDQAWVEVARGAPASVRRRLAELLDAGETARVGWLLRVHPQDVVPPLEDLLAEDFATVFRDAMDIDVRGRRPTAAQRDALLLPSLQALPASDPAGRQVRLWRARIRMERGERARAAMLAQSIVAAADAAGDERAEAYLLLAQLAETEAGRAAHVARALEAAVDPALARRVAREGATGPGEPQSRPRP
jgi:hypothetical protein